MNDIRTLSITNLKGFLKQAQIPSNCFLHCLCNIPHLQKQHFLTTQLIAFSALGFSTFFNVHSSEENCSVVNPKFIKQKFLQILETWIFLKDQYQLLISQALFALQGWVYVLVSLKNSRKHHNSAPPKSTSGTLLLFSSPISKCEKLQILLPRGQFHNPLATEFEAWAQLSSISSQIIQLKQENVFLRT